MMRSAAMPSRIALQEGERLMGYYTDDEMGNELNGLAILGKSRF